MPRLLLLRHAKAERARPGERDFDRVLAERGQADSAAVGKQLKARGERPALVLVSAAARTRETWERLAATLGEAPEPRYLPELYEAGDYLPLLRREADGADSIMVVGHNPAIHETALALTESLAGPDGASLKRHFPTAALAILDFDRDWAKLKPGKGRLVAFLRPETASE